nr:ferrous iron transport protein A [Propionibacterium sp.]
MSVALAQRDLAVRPGSGQSVPENSLARLRRGGAATIVRVLNLGDPAASRRLFDLGFVPGAHVECVRRAPLGDPAIYRVADYEIALRRAQAACIEIEGAR